MWFRTHHCLPCHNNTSPMLTSYSPYPQATSSISSIRSFPSFSSTSAITFTSNYSSISYTPSISFTPSIPYYYSAMWSRTCRVSPLQTYFSSSSFYSTTDPSSSFSTFMFTTRSHSDTWCPTSMHCHPTDTANTPSSSR